MSEPTVLSYASRGIRLSRATVAAIVVLWVWSVLDLSLGGTMAVVATLASFESGPPQYASAPFILVGGLTFIWGTRCVRSAVHIFRRRLGAAAEAIAICRVAEIGCYLGFGLLIAYGIRDHAWSNWEKLRDWIIGSMFYAFLPLLVTITRMLLRNVAREGE